ncbi:MAG TPA: patatin-like phospholipase family protein, partial [Actinomycetota bacterium]
GVTVHVLPAGAEGAAGVDLSQLRYRDASRIDEYIQRAYEASAAYLAGASAGRPAGGVRGTPGGSPGRSRSNSSPQSTGTG